jgi:hypothetical protein
MFPCFPCGFSNPSCGSGDNVIFRLSSYDRKSYPCSYLHHLDSLAPLYVSCFPLIACVLHDGDRDTLSFDVMVACSLRGMFPRARVLTDDVLMSELHVLHRRCQDSGRWVLVAPCDTEIVVRTDIPSAMIFGLEAVQGPMA